MAMTELNMAQDCLEYKDRLPAKTHRWWEANHLSITHNKQDKQGDTYQPGGTAIVVLDALSHKTTKPGDDTTGLGQWSWVCLRGKEDHFLRLVSLYRPCKSDGRLTTYQQHIRWYTKQGKNACPKKQILDNLHEQVEQWQSARDIVIILVDINEDVCLESISSKFQEMGLVEAITAIHGNTGPNTHNRGQHPIDGIFVPRQLVKSVMAGYYAFGKGIPSDHQVLWIDIPLDALGWFTIPSSVPLQA